MYKKKIPIIFSVIILLIGGIIAAMFYYNQSKIIQFNIADYNDFINKFSSNEILGKVHDINDAKDKAEKLWLKIYGERIKKEKPYRVFFDDANQVWFIKESTPKSLFKSVKGGVANIIMQKPDGKVLAVWHTK